MELCGIGYPTNQPIDHDWPAVLKQVEAQGCGLLLAVTRGHKPAEAEFMIDKGFAPVYQFENPRTGTIATTWLKDFTKEGQFKTELPPQIVVQARGAPASQSPRTARAVLNDMYPTASGSRRAPIIDPPPAAQVIDAEVVSDVVDRYARYMDEIRELQATQSTPRLMMMNASSQLEDVDTTTWIPYTAPVAAASSPVADAAINIDCDF